jgi:hypothetical protein
MQMDETNNRESEERSWDETNDLPNEEAGDMPAEQQPEEGSKAQVFETPPAETPAQPVEEEPRFQELGRTTVEERPIERPVERRPRSIFFPLVLIVLGVVFLMRNTGVITGDVWDTLLRLWPLVLVAIGFDSLIQKQGLVGSIFWISLGVVLLMANLGILALNVWTVILNLWPLLLIAIGFDLIIGRRSRIASLVALAFLLLILVAALWFLAGGYVIVGQPAVQAVGEPLGAASQGQVSLKPAVGLLQVSALDSGDDFYRGSVSAGPTGSLLHDFRLQNGTAYLNIHTERAGIFSVAGQDRWTWDIQFSPQIPIVFDVDMAVGEANLDLTGLDVPDLEVNLGVGRVVLSGPGEGPMDATISAGIGETIIVVPAGAPVRVQFDSAISTADFPAGYRQDGSVYTSPSYDTSTGSAINIYVSQAIGRLKVSEER